ncbi:MAG: hypothetical protein WC877_00315 [Dehalococcoidales bacterium]|jgi:hypothetical protein
MSDKADPEIVNFILRDMNENLINRIVTIRNRQKKHDNFMAMDEAVRLIEMKCRGIEGKESWYKVLDKRCPICNTKLLQYIGPKMMLKLNWSRDPVGYCIHCEKTLLLNGEIIP